MITLTNVVISLSVVTVVGAAAYAGLIVYVQRKYDRWVRDFNEAWDQAFSDWAGLNRD